MDEKGPKPPNLKQVTPGGSLNQMDPSKELEAALPSCFEHIEKTEYAEAFEVFAATLEKMERLSAEAMNSDATQRNAKKLLSTLWKVFIKDITDFDKKSRRLAELRPDKEALDKDMVKWQETLKSATTDASSDRLVYERALEEQRRRQSAVTPFSSEEAQQAHWSRNTRSAVDEFIKAVAKPINDVYRPHFENMAYVAALYNDVLPLIREITEGYVKQLLPKPVFGNAPRPLPITSERIRVYIVNFLKAAPDMAKKIGELQLKRNDLEHP